MIIFFAGLRQEAPCRARVGRVRFSEVPFTFTAIKQKGIFSTSPSKVLLGQKLITTRASYSGGGIWPK